MFLVIEINEEIFVANNIKNQKSSSRLLDANKSELILLYFLISSVRFNDVSTRAMFFFGQEKFIVCWDIWFWSMAMWTCLY